MEEELKREQILKFIPRDIVENCESNENISETLQMTTFMIKVIVQEVMVLKV